MADRGRTAPPGAEASRSPRMPAKRPHMSLRAGCRGSRPCSVSTWVGAERRCPGAGGRRGLVVCLPNRGDASQAGCFVAWAVAPVELGTKAPTFPPGWARRRLGLGGTSESPCGTQTLVGCFSGKGGRYPTMASLVQGPFGGQRELGACVGPAPRCLREARWASSRPRACGVGGGARARMDVPSTGARTGCLAVCTSPERREVRLPSAQVLAGPPRIFDASVLLMAR